MNTKSFFHATPAAVGLAAALWLNLAANLPAALAYPPAIGILSHQKNCLQCHANSGPWKDDEG